MNNSSCLLAEDENFDSLLITSVNIHMTLVVLSFLCNISALFILFRRSLRGKIMTPLMVNLNAVSLVQSTFGYALSIGTSFKMQKSSQGVSLCNWVAFADLLSQLSYSSTLCAMNVVSKLVSGRCYLGASQQITKNSKVIFFVASWFYSITLSGSILLEQSLSAPSASKLTCQLNWPSHESHVPVFNVIIVLMVLLLPMFICSTMQYLCSRIWKNSRSIVNRARQKSLAYRRKSNRMVIALTLSFFFGQLPLYLANIVSMTTGCYSYSSKTAFILELLAQSNVCHAPFVYVFLNAGYRTELKRLIAGSSTQTNTRPGAEAAGRDPRGGVEVAGNRLQGRRPQRFNNEVGQSPQKAGTATEQLIVNGKKPSYTGSATCSVTSKPDGISVNSSTAGKGIIKTNVPENFNTVQ